LLQSANQLTKQITCEFVASPIHQQTELLKNQYQCSAYNKQRPDGGFENVWLSGPAVRVFDGEVAP
jgi:hypothetical protein